MLHRSSSSRERVLVVGAVAVACIVTAPSRAEAQWRQAPAGVSLRVAPDSSRRAARAPTRAGYAVRGAVLGAAVAAAGAYFFNGDECSDDDRECRMLLAAQLAPLGAVLGAFVGALAYGDRHVPTPPRDSLPPPPMPRELADYMGLGALAGAGLAVGATYRYRCDGCSVQRELLQNVPLGAAAGAVVGAVAYGLSHRERKGAKGR